MTAVCGADPRPDSVRARFRKRLFGWLGSGKRRTTVTDEAVHRGADAHRAVGIHIGIW